jgi:hypothetical protein
VHVCVSLFFFYFLFWCVGSGVPGLVLARQILYHLSYAPGPFLL